MTPEEAVERAYQAFAHYSLPPVMEHCDHCSTELEATLHAPLRDLTDDRVDEYVGSAMGLVGDSNDFRHFAPRVLADAVLGRATDEAWYLKKFREAGFAQWPEAERRAVTDALDAAWQRRLSTRCSASRRRWPRDRDVRTRVPSPRRERRRGNATP